MITRILRVLAIVLFVFNSVLFVVWMLKPLNTAGPTPGMLSFVVGALTFTLVFCTLVFSRKLLDTVFDTEGWFLILVFSLIISSFTTLFGFFFGVYPLIVR